jgi:hypothetical protein
VTVSGESAGAISICGHFALPLSKGLFQQVLLLFYFFKNFYAIFLLLFILH